MDPVKLPWEKTFDNGAEEHWKATTRIGTYSFRYIYKEFEIWCVTPPGRRICKVGECGCSLGENESLDVTGCKSVDDLKALAEKDYYDKTHEFSGDIFECPKAWIKNAITPSPGDTTLKLIVEVPNAIDWGGVCITGSGQVVPKEAL